MNQFDRRQSQPARWQLPYPLRVFRIGRHPAAWFGLVLMAWQMAASLVSAQSAVVNDNKPLAKPKPAAEPALGTDWVRLKYDDQGELVGLQTAIVRYASPKATNGRATTNGGANANGAKASDTAPTTPSEIVVDLIGAVHIADVAYYRELNERFKQYDALLYELVAPEGTVVERGRGASNTHPIGFMQNAIKSFLELDHQLQYIDYTKPNFVHADLSPDQFLAAMRDRNETFIQLYFRLMGQAMEQQSKMSSRGESLDFDLLSALFAKDRARRLKVAMAKQMAEMESMMVSLGGEQGTVLITDRNKRALEVLRAQSKAGKKKFGIFYGAGHLADMHDRLVKDFGLVPVEITWLTAWDLAEKP